MLGSEQVGATIYISEFRGLRRSRQFRFASEIPGKADSPRRRVNDKYTKDLRSDGCKGGSAPAARGDDMGLANPLAPSGIALWTLKVAGSFAVSDSQGGKDATPRGRKARAIIAYLAARPDARVSREKITELLWGDRGEEQARASLRQALLEIRHAAPGLICSDRGHVWLDEKMVEIDAISLAEGEGEFTPFEDLDHISQEFDDWLEIERSRRKRDASAILRTMVEKHLADGRGASALHLVEAMWRIDPYSEDALRLALQAEYQAGHPAAIEQRFQAMETLLRDDLGVEPAAETRALHHRLLADLRQRKSLKAPLRREQDATSRTGWDWRRWLAALLIPLAVLAVIIGWQQIMGGQSQKRIAVLPFKASEGVDELVAEGMAEELRVQLSRHDGIETIGRASSWIFKDSAEDVRRVGQQLGADLIVGGKIHQTKGGMQATIELVDAKDATIIWSQRFLSPSNNIQRIETAALDSIIRTLGLRPAHLVTQTDPVAFANYMRAKAMIRDRDWTKMLEARELLRQAVRIDPNFAPAWAQLGGVINFIGPETSPDANGPENGWHDEALVMARRSIALDPKLAEGHAMLAFIQGFDTEEGRAHLRQALALGPNNAQIIYWHGLAAGYAGDVATSRKAIRRALEIDPLWRRPIESAGQWAIWEGQREEAYRYVGRLRGADPSAAVEIEMAFAREEGDLSRVVEIGRREPMIVGTTSAKMTLSWSLIELGYVQEGLLLGEADPFDRLLHHGRLPSRQAILDHVRPFIGYSEELFMVRPILMELARTNRCADVAALYDQPASRLRELGKVKAGNWQSRMSLGGLMGWCLAKAGRRVEAAQLYRAADDAGRIDLPDKMMGPADLVSIATNDAILGRRERALGRLERAVAMGWLAYEGLNFRLCDMPWFASLQAEPRFHRLCRVTEAKLQRERLETAALGVI